MGKSCCVCRKLGAIFNIFILNIFVMNFIMQVTVYLLSWLTSNIILVSNNSRRCKKFQMVLITEDKKWSVSASLPLWLLRRLACPLLSWCSPAAWHLPLWPEPPLLCDILPSRVLHIITHACREYSAFCNAYVYVIHCMSPECFIPMLSLYFPFNNLKPKEAKIII